MANHQYPYQEYPIPAPDPATAGMEVCSNQQYTNIHTNLQAAIPLSPYTKAPLTPYKYAVDQHPFRPTPSSLTEGTERPPSETGNELLPKPHSKKSRSSSAFSALGGLSSGEGPLAQTRILGLRLSHLLVLLSSILILLIAALGLVAVLLSNRIASLQSSMSSSSPSPSNSSSSSSSPTQPAVPAGPVATNTVVDNFQYLGCYVQDSENVLSSLSKTDSRLTNQNCAGYCVGYKYFGTEEGNKCHCGDEIPSRAVKGNEWNCNAQCEGRKGSKQEICGGVWFLGIWERVE